MVLGETMLTEAFATAAGEHQGGGVEQHDREVGEQMTPAFKQRFLDQILGPSGCPCGAALVGQRLTQPGSEGPSVQKRTVRNENTDSFPSILTQKGQVRSGNATDCRFIACNHGVQYS